MISTIGFIGGGDFGSFLAERIHDVEPHIEIRIWDVRERVANSTLKDTARSDVVIFTVPPEKYESSMREVIPLMREEGIIGDVCGVKMHTVRLLHLLANDRRYFACHPMFGRQSFVNQKNSLKGLEIALCEENLDQGAYLALRHILIDCLHLVLTNMTPEEHDRVTAEEQLLPQHVGRIIEKAGFARSVRGAHTVSSRHFYTAMEIVAGDNDLFHQMCRLNPFWPEIEARYELAAAQHRLETIKRRNGNA